MTGMKRRRWTPYRVVLLAGLLSASGAAVFGIPLDRLPGRALLFIIRVAICVAICVAAWVVVVHRLVRPFLRGMKEAKDEYHLRVGRCLNCGYSLRGNQSGICPECGVARTH